jgi:hypothetical protein
MRAVLKFVGKWKLSKQNSYLAGRYGRKYKNPAYVREQARMLICMHPQLLKQGWKSTKNQVDLKIFFYGPTRPCDWDNCGLLTDSMQGVSQTIGGKRFRGTGPVVWDDSQFNPVMIKWIKESERKIIVEIEELKGGL